MKFASGIKILNALTGIEKGHEFVVRQTILLK
jgi:hypothetical protein